MDAIVLARPNDRGNARFVRETPRRQDEWPMREVNAAPRPEIITQDEMRDLIRVEVEAAGSIPQLCRNLRMRSSAPVYLALQEEREISDWLAMYFAFERITMFRRIGHAARR